MRPIIAAAFVLAAVGVARPSPTVFFEPPAVQVEEGQTFTLSVRVDAGADTLTCFLVEFSFDCGVMELLSADEGTLFAESGLLTMFNWDEIVPGLHSCNDVTLGFESFVMCPGELVHLEFHATEEGLTPLTFTAVDLRDIRRERILPVFTEGGSVTVTEGTGVDGAVSGAGLSLRCFPNPFRGSTTIELAADAPVEAACAAVIDVAGRLVARPELKEVAPGRLATVWNARDRSGRDLPVGVYFVSVSLGSETARRRVTMIR